MKAVVESVSRDGDHRFSKMPVGQITVIAGIGVEGDTHAGRTVQHRSRVRRDPTQPNLRQVHIIHAELLDEVNGLGYDVSAATLGENLLTRGIDLLGLPRDTRLRIGDAVLRVTGLRNPCQQIEAARPGLLKLLVYRDEDGAIVRRCGIMTVVEEGGTISAGDAIAVELPEGDRLPLEAV